MDKRDNKREGLRKIKVHHLQDSSLLLEIYKRLFDYYGPQYWWPADNPFEVVVGAILTQNTAWGNVEKAIENLKREKLLNPSGLYRVSVERLASVIRPSGYYNIKAKRLKAFLGLLFDDYGGDLRLMFEVENGKLREKLLSVKGVGEETADSILLYAGEVPIFVVDSYTKRIFSRHKFVSPEASYPDIQQIFMKRLPPDTQLFNEYHALIVRVGKGFCKKKPLCGNCPLSFLFTALNGNGH